MCVCRLFLIIFVGCCLVDVRWPLYTRHAWPNSISINVLKPVPGHQPPHTSPNKHGTPYVLRIRNVFYFDIPQFFLFGNSLCFVSLSMQCRSLLATTNSISKKKKMLLMLLLLFEPLRFCTHTKCHTVNVTCILKAQKLQERGWPNEPPSPVDKNGAVWGRVGGGCKKLELKSNISLAYRTCHLLQ